MKIIVAISLGALLLTGCATQRLDPVSVAFFNQRLMALERHQKETQTPPQKDLSPEMSSAFSLYNKVRNERITPAQMEFILMMMDYLGERKER